VETPVGLTTPVLVKGEILLIPWYPPSILWTEELKEVDFDVSLLLDLLGIIVLLLIFISALVAVVLDLFDILLNSLVEEIEVDGTVATEATPGTVADEEVIERLVWLPINETLDGIKLLIEVGWAVVVVVVFIAAVVVGLVVVGLTTVEVVVELVLALVVLILFKEFDFVKFVLVVVVCAVVVEITAAAEVVAVVAVAAAVTDVLVDMAFVILILVLLWSKRKSLSINWDKSKWSVFPLSNGFNSFAELVLIAFEEFWLSVGWAEMVSVVEIKLLVLALKVSSIFREISFKLL